MQNIEPKSGVSIANARLHVAVQELWARKRIDREQLRVFNEIQEQLDSIHSSLEFYDNHPLYMLLHRELHRLLKGIVPVYSFQININLRPGNHVPAKLDFDLYPNPPAPREFDVNDY